MVRLSREIRFSLVPSDQVTRGAPVNSWAGWPSSNLVTPHLVLRCVIEGIPDPSTGFLCNITAIDSVLRSIVTDRLIPVFDGNQTAEELIQIVFQEVSDRWNSKATIVSVTLALSPYSSYSIDSGENMNMQTTRTCLTHQFEFSAAHQLLCHDLSDDENRALFGKCNNPEGHGHNYVVEVTLSNELGPKSGEVIALGKFESTVKRLVIDRLDHRHLNRDIEYFATTNPTVENIAIAIYQWLAGQFGDAKLEKIRVYETPKTWAEFAGHQEFNR